MNDRYLFRGKRIDNGEWLEGGVYHQLKDDVKDEKLYIIGGSLNDVGCAYEVIPETVGQCTGLKDKNGKLIFEGDICEYRDSTGVIGFDNGDAMFTFTYDENIQTDFSCIWGKDLEILGNIHDNSELLEADEK